MSFFSIFSLCVSSVAMDSTLLITSPCDISLLIDIMVSRIEILREVIVKSTGLSVMLTSDHDQRVDFAASHIAHVLVFSFIKTDSRGVADRLLTCLLSLLARLD